MNDDEERYNLPENFFIVDGGKRGGDDGDKANSLTLSSEEAAIQSLNEINDSMLPDFDTDTIEELKNFNHLHAWNSTLFKDSFLIAIEVALKGFFKASLIEEDEVFRRIGLPESATEIEKKSLLKLIKALKNPIVRPLGVNTMKATCIFVVNLAEMVFPGYLDSQKIKNTNWSEYYNEVLKFLEDQANSREQ